MSHVAPSPSPSPSPSLSEINPDDVLCGRGGMTNNHEGNRRFRELVAQHQSEYLLAKKKQKMEIANRIVRIIEHRGGRFLKKHADGVWAPVPPKKAQTKTSQALREGLDVRHKTIRPEKMPRRYRQEDEEEHGPRKRVKVVDGRVILAAAPAQPQERSSPSVALADDETASHHAYLGSVHDDADADAHSEQGVPELTHDPTIPHIFGLPPNVVAPLTEFDMLNQTAV